MSDPHDDASSEAGRALARHRWGPAAVVRAAAVVISRAHELPDAVRAEVHQVTEAGQDREAAR